MARNHDTYSEASPLDKDFFTGDFRRELDEGESIDTATVTIHPTGALEAVGDPEISGTKVTVKLRNGEPGERYVVTFSITTSSTREISRPTIVPIAEENTPLRPN